MSEYFNCNLCDKSIKINSKKKYSNSQNRKSLGMKIVSRYSVTNPDILNIYNISKNYVLDYNKIFVHNLIICKWKLHFSNTIISVEFDKWCCILDDFYLRNLLLLKNKNYQKRGH